MGKPSKWGAPAPNMPRPWRCHSWWVRELTGIGRTLVELWTHPGQNECVLTIEYADHDVWRFPALHPSLWTFTPDQLEDALEQYVRRGRDLASKRAEDRAASDTSWVTSHPALWEYLTLERYSDGTEREPSMLCAFVEDGMVKLALQDRAEGRSLWVTAWSLPSALDALEGKLQAGDGEWRNMRGQSPKGGKRK